MKLMNIDWYLGSFQSVGTTMEDICYKMFCWDPILPNVCSTKSSAAPGTSCGPQKVKLRVYLAFILHVYKIRGRIEKF